MRVLHTHCTSRVGSAEIQGSGGDGGAAPRRTGGAKAGGVTSQVIGKDDTSHGGFTGPTLAHQQHLATVHGLLCLKEGTVQADGQRQGVSQRRRRGGTGSSSEMDPEWQASSHKLVVSCSSRSGFVGFCGGAPRT
jgi:hypothetical protein